MRPPAIVLCLLLATPAARASAGPLNLTNGGFDAGDFTGWNVTIPIGMSFESPVAPFDPATVVPDDQRPASLAGNTDPLFYVPTGHARIVQSVELGLDDQLFEAVEGDSFAMLSSESHRFVNTPADDWRITAAQAFSIEANHVLSGWSFFFNGDWTGEDMAWVKILDSAGIEIATPWIQYSGDFLPGHLNSVSWYQATPWTKWEWQAPANGTYTVLLGVSHPGGRNFSTISAHDAIRVPEPSVLALLSVGLIAGLRRRCSPAE